MAHLRVLSARITNLVDSEHFWIVQYWSADSILSHQLFNRYSTLDTISQVKHVLYT